jgi:SHS family lactate transporter-like MFS transporter
MATSVHDGQSVWWLEPTRDQWHAWTAVWLGRKLDSFEFTIFIHFTIFVLIVLPIAQEFNVPLKAVAAVSTLTLWLRPFGASGTGWLADRIGRTKPLMISTAWFSTCNFIADLSPSLVFCPFSARQAGCPKSHYGRSAVEEAQPAAISRPG